MITMTFQAAKQGFFDRAKVKNSVDAGTRQVLSKFGAFVRQRAKRSIRKKTGTSPPGSPPHSHVGLLRKFILFAYDPQRKSVVIGPTLIRAESQAPRLLERGGETKYKPHSLVWLKAEGVDAKAALLWRVYPSKDVQRTTSPRGLFEFAAPPGNYEVELLVVTNTDGTLSVEEARVSVTIESCTPAPPKPDPKPPEGGKLDPVNALGRIRFGNAGCTATVIGPRHADGKWDVLTASHCVLDGGARGTLTLKDDRTLGIRVVAYHKTPDVAWCVTEDSIADLPYALIAAKNPEPGTAIWHMGYGVDQPNNREDGTVAERENGQGQLGMVLSVSSGDSGGGIFRSDTNELVSVVCCTSGMAQDYFTVNFALLPANLTIPPSAFRNDLASATSFK